MATFGHVVPVTRSVMSHQAMTGVASSEDLDAGAASQDDEELRPIRWIEIIFLPFQFWWQIVIIVVVCFKCFFGPLHAVLPFLTCAEYVNRDKHLYILKLIYAYICDAVYIFDTFLYILHRQVVDEALKREYQPKSGLLILVDIFSMLPLYALFADSQCNVQKLWPNILAFSEMLVIYRMSKFFSLRTTHHYASVALGYALLCALVTHALVCALLLATAHGLCKLCARTQDHYFDWRQYHTPQMGNARHSNTTLYFYGAKFVSELLIHHLSDPSQEKTIVGISLQTLIMMLSYLLIILIVMPKLFCECFFRLKRIHLFHVRVKKIIGETRRRNPLEYSDVEEKYKVIWEKQRGINHLSILRNLPLYLRSEICQELGWAVFYHSPSLRKTSVAYKRWLSKHIILKYKLPGERFFIGPDCYTNLYYLKSGIVQLISEDDSTAPLLSVSGGTLIGDVSFYVPPAKRKVVARCLTYCEVFSISRKWMLVSLYKFPADHKHVSRLVQERLQHARDLQRVKAHVRGDRATDEGVAWLQRRWWQIAEALRQWKHSSKKKNKCVIPKEDDEYHCAKYIGQLVLCNYLEHRKESLFLRTEFPWILARDNQFYKIWHVIVICTVTSALFLYPQILVRMHTDENEWLIYYTYVIDLIYTADVIVALVSAEESVETVNLSLMAVAYYRMKQITFYLDILSTFVIGGLLTVILGEEYKILAMFNRLFKTYKLVFNRNSKSWNINSDPLKRVCYVMGLTFFCFGYITPHFIWLSVVATNSLKHKLSYRFFFGPPCASRLRALLKNHFSPNETCLIKTTAFGTLEIPISWAIRLSFIFFNAESKLDVIINGSIILSAIAIFTYQKMKLTAIFYLRYQAKNNYQHFVSKLEAHYSNVRIHPDLMTRLRRYLNCYWRTNVEGGAMRAAVLRREPPGVYAQLHAAVAERAIGSCSAFRGADPQLVRDIARQAEFLILPKNSILVMFGHQTDKVMWIINGIVQCEYHSETGEILRTIFPSRRIVSMGSVFLNRASLRTYITVSDVEILSLKVSQCFAIIKRYPDEEACFAKCAEELVPSYDRLFVAYLKKHRDYQRKVREQRQHAKQSQSSEKEQNEKTVAPQEGDGKAVEQSQRQHEKPRKKIRFNFFKSKDEEKEKPKSEENTEEQSEKQEKKPKRKPRFVLKTKKLPAFIQEFRTNPESKFTLCWLTFRALTVFAFIVADALDGLCNDLLQWWFRRFCLVLSTCASLDIVIKMFLPYYDERGLVITSVRKCALHYMSRGFLVDVLALVFGSEGVLETIFSSDDITTKYMIRGTALFLSIYLFTGFFNYLADKPSANTTFLMILKWYLVTLTILNYAVIGLFITCVEVKTGNRFTIKDQCWMPERFGFQTGQNLTTDEFWIIVASALDTAFGAFLNVESGWSGFKDKPYLLFLTMVTWFCALFWWVVTCFLTSTLMLDRRSSSQFKHGVAQLQAFLEEERVEPHLIQETINHFSYCWKRTTGVDMKFLINERISAVFRQDLNYYFFKETLHATDTLLRGGDVLARRLASSASEMHFLKGARVVHEMHLCDTVYVLHRGTLMLTSNGENVALLTKGSIFGQLYGTRLRPLRVTATAREYADLLAISVHDFQIAINDDVRYNIADHPQSRNDYMAIKKAVAEDPYNSITFILRKSKTIKLPGMHEAARADSSAWYARWLLTAWLAAPALGVALSAFIFTHARHGFSTVPIALLVVDVIYCLHVITDFFSVRLVVGANNRCVYKHKVLRKLKSWRFYCDAASLALPAASLAAPASAHALFALSRFLRLHSITLYYAQFCKDYNMRTATVILKVTLFLLLLHVLACGFVGIACVSPNKAGGRFPLPVHKERPKEMDDLIDLSTWKWVDEQALEPGCPIRSPVFAVRGRRVAGYLKPRVRRADYLLALAHVVALLTGTNLALIVTVAADEIAYNVLVKLVLQLATLWFTSDVIGSTYAKLRQMYIFDYDVATLLKYMKRNGISKSLQQAVKRYTFLLWRRSKGNEIPSLALDAPVCLRQDLFSSLFMHHLRAPPLLCAQPDYFLRQLAVRMKKVVIFPGKSIVEKGDINQILYFIHEGEVERWFVDDHGDRQLSSVLTMNMYFGLIPGLFPHSPYRFSYCTRTVVQFVCLKYDDWYDLLDSYPEIKRDIYDKASKLRRVGELKKKESLTSFKTV